MVVMLGYFHQCEIFSELTIVPLKAGWEQILVSGLSVVFLKTQNILLNGGMIILECVWWAPSPKILNTIEHKKISSWFIILMQTLQQRYVYHYKFIDCLVM